MNFAVTGAGRILILTAVGSEFPGKTCNTREHEGTARDTEGVGCDMS